MTLTIDLPDTLAEAVDKRAKRAGQTSDAVIADALRALLSVEDNEAPEPSVESLLDRLSPLLGKAKSLQTPPLADGELPWSQREGFD